MLACGPLVQASLGGHPGRMALVHAYIRVRSPENAPHDFDQSGGSDTLWQRIYLCLRSGFHAEAVEVAPLLATFVPNSCKIHLYTLSLFKR